MLSLNLEHVRTFLVVARHLHFGRAAALLNLSQPAVSTHVRRLEQAVGASLLERNSRSVSLTEDGARFAGHMRDVMDAVDFAVASVGAAGRADETAPLRVACTPTSATLAPQLRATAGRASDLPVVDVQWDVDVIEGVRDGHWSFGVGHALGDDDGELSVTHLRDDALRLIVSAGGATGQRRLRDLVAAELVLPPRDLAPGWRERLRSILVSITGQEPTIREVPVTNARWLDDVLSHVDGAAPDRVAYTVVPASGVPPRVPSVSLKPLAVPLVMVSRPSLVRPDAREALRVVLDALASRTKVDGARPGADGHARGLTGISQVH